MKFEVGDKVVVKHSNEEADVIEVINDKMVMVQVRGVKFPVYNDQLEYPYFKRFTEKKLFPTAEKPKAKTFIDQVPREKVTTKTKQQDGIWLMFLPVFGNDVFGDEVVDVLKVHLINGTSLGYNFTYRANFLGVPDFELKNEIFNNQSFYLHDIDFEKINDSPVFEIDFSLINPDKKKAEHYEASLKLRPKQVFNKIEEIKSKNEPSFQYLLVDKYPDALPEEKIELSKLANSGFKIYEASKARQHLDPPRYTIDLHMERLTDSWKHMTSFEILSMQLREFEKYYDLAVAHRQPSLTVIHGLGTGRLKDEIHELLRRRSEVNYFVNQYHASYGYGATEIYFKY